MLRAPEISDIEFVYQCENDPERLLHGRTGLPYSRELIKNYIINYNDNSLSSGAIRFIVDFNGRQAGIADLYDMDISARKAFVSIYIANEFRHQGVGGNTLDDIISFARDHLGLNQVVAVISSENVVSSSFFEKKGFKLIAALPQWTRSSNGQLIDALLMQRLL